MPPKSQNKKQKLVSEEAAQATRDAESATSADALADETSDSECEYDTASRQIGGKAARQELGVPSRGQ